MAQGLSAYLRETMATPFRWGHHDCATWAARWASCVSGVDCAPWAGAYTTEAGADEYTAAHGGPVACFGSGIERGMKRLDSPAPYGVGIIMVGDKMICAIRSNVTWCFLTPTGVGRVRDAKCIAAWGV